VERSGGFGYWLRTYLVLGALWCAITNVHAAVTGAPTALVAASGPDTGAAKAAGVAGVLAKQIGVWPADVYERVVRPLLG
jgi:hypothetical protein